MSDNVIALSRYRQPGSSPPSGSARGQGTFTSFAQIEDYLMPDPVWVSEDMSKCDYAPADRKALEDFFGWFGLEVDTSVCPESLCSGWEHVIGELGAPAQWKRNSPQTYRAVCGDWPPEQHAYLDAIIQGDRAAAAALVHRTPFGLLIQQKMQTPKGSALKKSQV